ncbi:di-N-acetylchitobiase-like isoform X2 [Acanthaster planci]|uniref:Di-N-acetylchitobiase n=1 Tax=Acanthaster planci TaxID=133434 RepID=A0A8B7YYZ9_ACAPL|nr:di-N-acetylchitobiase-like isoform X2 [Acanthaster planci]
MANLSRVFCVSLLCLVVLWEGGSLGTHSSTDNGGCPCPDPDHCKVISSPPRKEVFGFWVGSTVWKHFDWTRITTIVMFHRHDSQLMCYAHARGVRVVSMGVFPAGSLSNVTARSAWIMARVNETMEEHLDGINIDIEYPLNKSEAHLLTDLVAETTKAFHTAIPNSQVTFDVAWSPDCIDERCYDYKGIAEASDFVFIMAYSEQSQIYGPCIAMANAPYNKTVKGIQGYLALGIPSDKLVLGVAWDGVDYVCLNISKDNVCYIEHVPFRGAPCSDAPAKERTYSFIQTKLLDSTTGRLYNATYASPYYNYKSDVIGQIRQVWYDDVESLTLRYEYAKHVNLHGVGMWTVDSLNYSQTPVAENQTRAMWEAIDKFLH